MGRRYIDDNGVARVTLRDTPARAASLAAAKPTGTMPIGTSGPLTAWVPRERGLWVAIKQNVAFHFIIEDPPCGTQIYELLRVFNNHPFSQETKNNEAKHCKTGWFLDFHGAQKPRNLPWT